MTGMSQVTEALSHMMSEDSSFAIEVIKGEKLVKIVAHTRIKAVILGLLILTPFEFVPLL